MEKKKKRNHLSIHPTSFRLLDRVPLGQSPRSSSSTPGLFLLGPKLLFMSLLCINNFVQKE